MPTSSLGVLDSIVRDAIRDGEIPGAVLLVWHNGQVVYRKAFGARAASRDHDRGYDLRHCIAHQSRGYDDRGDATGAEGRSPVE